MRSLWDKTLIVTTIVAVWSHLGVAQIQLFDGNTTELDNPVSAKCANAMAASIDCSDLFTFYPNTDYQGPFDNPDAQDQFCSATCTNSLASFHSQVSNACQNDPDPFEGLPATFGGDRLSAYQQRTCLKDSSTGEYCNSQCFRHKIRIYESGRSWY